MNLVAPSPSRAIPCARRIQTLRRARSNGTHSGCEPSRGPLPSGHAAPLARRRVVSLVDMSPSTTIMLKLSSTAARRASCKYGGETAASVAMKASMVAMWGAIIAAPLAIPATVIVLSGAKGGDAPAASARPRGRAKRAEAVLGTVSVVIIASTAASPPCGGEGEGADSGEQLVRVQGDADHAGGGDEDLSRTHPARRRPDLRRRPAASAGRAPDRGRRSWRWRCRC